jgi:hypothetical protein
MYPILEQCCEKIIINEAVQENRAFELKPESVEVKRMRLWDKYWL